MALQTAGLTRGVFFLRSNYIRAAVIDAIPPSLPLRRRCVVGTFTFSVVPLSRRCCYHLADFYFPPLVSQVLRTGKQQ